MLNHLLAAAMAVAAVAPAHPQQTAVAVSHADLRLSRAADVTRLDRRIARAAAAACGAASDSNLRGRNQAARCRRDTIAATATARARAIGGAGDAALAAAR